MILDEADPFSQLDVSSLVLLEHPLRGLKISLFLLDVICGKLQY